MASERGMRGRLSSRAELHLHDPPCMSLLSSFCRNQELCACLMGQLICVMFALHKHVAMMVKCRPSIHIAEASMSPLLWHSMASPHFFWCCSLVESDASLWHLRVNAPLWPLAHALLS